jgi:hypothetical protein
MLPCLARRATDGDLEIIEGNKAKGIAKIVATGVKYAFSGNKRTVMKELTTGFKDMMKP